MKVDFKYGVEQNLLEAYHSLYLLEEVQNVISEAHTKGSPGRITNLIFEMFKGCYESPDDVLSTTFVDNYDEIVYVNDMSFVSNCAHHNVPFFGRMHFGYLPKGKIVGLSKIPRLVEVYSRRPQVQEKLTQDIVDKFMEKIDPYGCGLVVEAYHLCMLIRGAKAGASYTKTTALRGTFKDNESTKREFLDGIKMTTKGPLWP